MLLDTTLSNHAIRKGLAVALLLATGFAAAPPVLAAPYGVPQAQAATQVLARGPGGVLTLDAALAYVEALQFSLQQAGHPVRFSNEDARLIVQRLAKFYPGLNPGAQQKLSGARNLWQQYARVWNTLPLEARREFAYDVIALAYGDQAAANALGIPAGGGQYTGSPEYYRQERRYEAQRKTNTSMSCWTCSDK